MSLVDRAASLVGSVPMWGEERRVAAARGAGAGPSAHVENGLVAAAAAGDRAALAALYDLHAPIVLGLARKMLRDPAAAEDLVHDVFLEVWQHAAEFDAARGSVRAWIVVRARSRALDRLGRSARDARAVDRVALDFDDDAPATPGIQVAIDGARMRGLLGDLPGELRAVLELAYFEGLSASEAAARLAIPVGTVKSRLARALNFLREAVSRSAERGS